MVLKPIFNGENRLKFSKKLFFKFQTFFLIKSFLFQKLINILTRGGKKIKSEKLVFNYLICLKKKRIILSNTSVSFFSMLDQSKPTLELVSKRLGKKVHQIPIPMRSHRQYTRCLRWLKSLLKKKKNNKNFFKLLVDEHYFILNDKTKSILLKKKQHLFALAFDNRMFTHFRWY